MVARAGAGQSNVDGALSADSQQRLAITARFAGAGNFSAWIRVGVAPYESADDADISGFAYSAEAVSGQSAVLTYETLAPDADVTDGGWTDQVGGSNLVAAIDEATADDADYIKSPDISGGPAIAKISLANPGYLPDGLLEVSYRCGKTGDDAAGLIVRLLQGSTTKATWTHDHLHAFDPQTFTRILTAAEFASITDFDDLYLEFESTVESGTYSSLTYRGSSVNNTNASSYTFSALDLGTPSDDRYVLVATMGDAGHPVSLRINGATAQQWSGQSGTIDIGISIAHVPLGSTGDIEIELAGTATAEAISWWTVRMGSADANTTAADSTAGANPVLTAAGMAIPAGGFAVGATAVAGDITSTTVSLDNSYVEAAAEQTTESWTFSPFQREVVAAAGSHTLTATWTANTGTEGTIALASFRGDGG